MQLLLVTLSCSQKISEVPTDQGSSKKKLTLTSSDQSISITENSNLTILITLSEILTKESTIQWVIPGSESDFLASSGNVIVKEGKNSAVVNISTLNDNIYEPNKMYKLNIFGDSEFYKNELILDLTLNDDDSPLADPSFSLSDFTTSSPSHARQIAVSTTVLNDATAVAWCLSEIQSVLPNSNDGKCSGGGGSDQGWYASPPSSINITNGDGLKTVYLWVRDISGNTNSNVISSSITLDTMHPLITNFVITDSVSSSTISTLDASVNVNVTSDDAVAWCLIEQNDVLSAPGKPFFSDLCFTTTKPTIETLDAVGNRIIYIFVKDAADNVSEISMQSITYTVNQPPVTVDDTLIVAVGTTSISNIDVLNLGLSDSDPELETLTITAVTNGTYGNLTINTGTTVTYTSVDTSYYGTDSFTYTISDPRGATAIGTVTVKIMTPHTWTGLGANSLWTNSLNWCGNIALNACQGDLSPPNNSEDAIFDGTCTNCNANINSNVDVLGVLLNTGYSGTVTQATGVTITVGVSQWLQSSGNFIGSDANIYLNGHLTDGAFTLNGGNFTSSSAVLKLNISGSGSDGKVFTETGGNFFHNNGTVDFDRDCSSSCGNYSFTMDLNNSITFYNLNYKRDTGAYNDAWVISNGDTVIVENNFSIIPSTGNIYSNGGTIEVRKNIIANIHAIGGDTQILLNGIGTQSYQTSDPASRFPNLVINKTSGPVAPEVGTTNLNVDLFSLVQGTFTAPTGTFTIAPNRIADTTVFSISPGTIYNHNNGIIHFSRSCLSSCGDKTYTIDVTNSIDFYNLKYDRPLNGSYTDKWRIATGDTLNVANDFTIAPSAGKVVSDGGVIDLKGNLLVGSNALGGTTQIKITDTDDQFYEYLDPLAGHAPVVVIDKPSGLFDPQLGTTDFAVSGFHLIQGTFNAPSSTFRVHPEGVDTTVFTQSPGTIYNHNNSKLQFYTDCPFNCLDRTYTINVDISLTLYDLDFLRLTTYRTLNYTLEMADKIVILNTFSAANTGIGGYTALSGGTYELEGNAIFSDGLNGGSSNLTFNGTSNQSLTQGASAVLPIGLWIVNNSAGITLLSDFTFGGLGHNLSIVLGDLNMNGFNLSTIDDISTYTGTITKNTGLLGYSSCTAGGCPISDL